MALSFYPRLKLSTQVSERHAMLIFEKILGGNFKKIILEEELYELDNGPYLFLELSHEGVDAIYKKKYVVLKVNIQDYISHE